MPPGGGLKPDSRLPGQRLGSGSGGSGSCLCFPRVGTLKGGGGGQADPSPHSRSGLYLPSSPCALGVRAGTGTAACAHAATPAPMGTHARAPIGRYTYACASLISGVRRRFAHWRGWLGDFFFLGLRMLGQAQSYSPSRDFLQVSPALGLLVEPQVDLINYF